MLYEYMYNDSEYRLYPKIVGLSHFIYTIKILQ